MFYNVIVPVFNEDKVILSFYNRLNAVINSIDDEFEILFVNDGSTDDSLGIIQKLSSEDQKVSYINLSRNFGKEAAMTAGLDHAEGDAVILIDADLQDPPELIPEMIRLWKEGYDVVYGQRLERHGESRLKKASAKYFYKIIGKVGRFSIPKDTGDFRLMSARAVRALRSLPETNRFMKGLFAWIGYPQIALKYNRDPRHAGNTKFNYWKLWNFALDGITSFTTLPLKIASYIGCFLALGAFLYGLFIISKTLLFGDPVKGYPSLMAVILFLGGIQLLFLGVIGEYLGRMFSEVKKRPNYLIDIYFKKQKLQKK